MTDHVTDTIDIRGGSGGFATSTTTTTNASSHDSHDDTTGGSGSRGSGNIDNSSCGCFPLTILSAEARNPDWEPSRDVSQVKTRF